MRVAVISDVHANLHALEAALDKIERNGVDEIWNLGDSVGYGPKPNECCELLQRLTALSLIGNHDLAALGQLSVDDFSMSAAAAATWTKEHLNASSREYLSELGPSSTIAGCALFHGSPRDPVWAYVLGGASAAEALSLVEEPLVLVGHSHLAFAASASADEVGFEIAQAGTTIDLSRGRWLLNPGSIGQPRDGDPRAAFLIVDLDRGSAEFDRVEYEVALTQAEMKKQKLPKQLASRLVHGL